MSGSARHDRLPSGAEADARPLNGWPSHPNRLVGREKDLEALHVLFLRGTARLVTVTGPPGVGKTRCAIELAAAITPEFDAGAVFVDLAPVRNAGMVADAIARALGVADHPDRPVLRRLQDHLSDRNILLLLDNFEHVIPAAGDVADLRAACPHVKVLVTSRQPLHIRWEHRYTLFIERARASDARFSVDERAAPIVAEICGRLDGLPLAIELAAAWSGALGLDAIRSRLSNAQALPLSGPRDVPERQRTLVDAIAWSYDLLNEAERRVFRALGAFAGEIPPDAIEAVCEGLRVDVLTPVAGLVDKNLLTRVEDGEARFRMLETIREFADERLELTGEADGVRRRHASWFLALAQRAERFIWSEHQAGWFERLENAHDNIRAALQWCLIGGDEETGVLLTAAMHRFWFAHGYFRGRTGTGARACGAGRGARPVGGRPLADDMGSAGVGAGDGGER